MKAKLPLRKTGLILMVVASLSLITSVTAYAQNEKPIVEMVRLGGTFVGFKITFPNDISGNFFGTVAGKGLDCTTTPPNVVYCIGPFQKGAGPSTLTLINRDTDEVVFKKIVAPPRPKSGNEKPICEEPPHSTSSSEEDPCIKIIPE